MNRFSSLLKFRKGKSPADAQARAHEEFPKRISRSRLKLRSPGESIPRIGRHFIIGVATYSAPELALLDQIEAILNQGEPQAMDVEVFDVLECKTMSDFEAFIPGIDSVYRTPILGVMSDGKLIDQATGLAEVAAVLHRFHLLSSSS
jgi:hypothetical protein